MSVLAHLSGPRRSVAIASAAALVAGGAWLALPSFGAAANNGLTIDPASGTTLAGSPTFNVAAPGCTGTANSAAVTIKGPGVVGENADGSKNMIGAKPAPPGSAISIGGESVSWDGRAVELSIPRPLNGTYLIKVQCVEDGDETGQAFFDREVTFVGSGAAGSNGTWTAVGQAATPTPTVGPTPTPTTGPTPTPTTGPTPTPTTGPTPTPTTGPTPTPTTGPTPTPTTGPTPTPTTGPTPTPTTGPTPTPTTNPPPTPTPPVGPNNGATQTLTGPGMVATNQAVTSADPVGTAVTSPVAGTVTISEGSLPSGTTPPAGYSLLGQQVTVTAPAASAAAPLKLEFRLDASLVGGSIPTVFRNGVPVAACTDMTGTAAAPDPCVELFDNLGGGDILLTVRTSAASTWNFGRPANPKPPTDIAAACRAGATVPAGWNVVQGTSGDDVLIGTAGADILRGLNGDDTLVGSSGNDVICGGNGDDLISGNTGHDLLLGDAGDDAVYGGAGDDAIGGGSGNDNLNGGLGDDLLSGGSGHDLMFGGRDDDVLSGDGGNDRIYGEDGSDRLYGGPGSDVLVVGRRF